MQLAAGCRGHIMCVYMYHKRMESLFRNTFDLYVSEPSVVLLRLVSIECRCIQLVFEINVQYKLKCVVVALRPNGSRF